MLLNDFDGNKEAIIMPEMCASRIDNFPEVTISCFSEKLFNKVLATFNFKKIGDVHSAVGLNPIYEVEYKGKRFALFHSLVGAPLCVNQYEDLMAMGSKRIILLGNCGVLDKNIEDFVLQLAKVAKETGLDGVVASAEEARRIRKEIGDDFIILCPATRPTWSSVNDQVRVDTPRDAILAGVDFMVVGRPITSAEDRIGAAKLIIDEIETALEEKTALV